MELRVTADYDVDADAAYIGFGRVADGEARQQLVIDDPRLMDGELIVDLDANGHVLGIELIGVKSMVSRPSFED